MWAAGAEEELAFYHTFGDLAGISNQVLLNSILSGETAQKGLLVRNCAVLPPHGLYLIKV